MFLLDEAAQPIRMAFNRPCYLVGTAAVQRDFRDVDVRLILDDSTYDVFAERIGTAVIPFLGLAIGEYLAARTGLPIDFQIQRMTEANAKHTGPRNPVGVRSLFNYTGDAAPEPAPPTP
jgi:hypothetical protein